MKDRPPSFRLGDLEAARAAFVEAFGVPPFSEIITDAPPIADGIPPSLRARLEVLKGGGK
jgi:hypothetical protein